jgi:membrane dipeptidase
VSRVTGGPTRRQLLRAGGLGALGLLAAPMLNFGRCRLFAATISARAVDLVLSSTVIDMLGLLTLDWPRLMRWQQSPGEFGEADFRRLESSGVSIFHPAVETGDADPYQGVLRWMLGWNRLLGARSCFLAPVATVRDLVQIPKRGSIGVIAGFQNSTHFRTTADVEAFHRLGQRVSQLTYNTRNRLGCGCYERHDSGLTPFGAEVIAEMNRLGMAVDLSHCGERTCREAITVSRRPVLVTHANCKALAPGQPRGKPDDVIRLLAAGGGVMGITVVRAFVGTPHGQPSPTLEDVLDHFQHVARVAGIEHVGLGSDVDVTAIDPATGRINPLYSIAGLEPAARVYQIADGLLRRGFSERDVKLVLGGNFLRALSAIFPDEPAGAPKPEPKRDPFCPPAHRRPAWANGR